MAPEQAGGKRALVGPATDIYALGVMLYQLLTGQLPFQRDSTLELLRAITSDEPTRPRRLRAPLAARPGSDHAALSGEGAQPSLPQRPGAGRRPGAVPRGETSDGAAGGGGRAAGPRMPAPAAGRAVGRASHRRRCSGDWLGSPGNGWKRTNNGTWQTTNGTWRTNNGTWRTSNGPWRRPFATSGRRETGGPVPGLPGLPGRRQRGAREPRRGRRRPPPRSQRRRFCGVGNGGTCTTGSMTALRWPRCLPVRIGFLIAAPDRLRVGVLTAAGLRITDLEPWGDSPHSTPQPPSLVPLGHERRREVTVTQTSRGLRVAAWVDNTAFDLLDDRRAGALSRPADDRQEPMEWS